VSRRHAERLDVVAVEVQRDVSEAVDVEQRRLQRAVDEHGLRQVEADEASGRRRAELGERNAGREMRGRRREQVAPVERPGDRLERVRGIRELVRLGDAVPTRARQSKPLSGPT
jgi:hypothetical protein